MNSYESILGLLSEFKSLTLNEHQAAKIIGVSAGTLANWRKGAIGPAYIKLENGKRARVMYPITAIADFLSNTIKTA